MLVDFICNRRVSWSGATATNISISSKQRLKLGHCNIPASLVKLLQTYCLVSDICAGPVQHNQTGVMVNMSSDPVALMPELLVGRK